MSDMHADSARVIEAHDECRRTYDKWQNAVAAELRGECTNATVDACYDLWRIAMNDAVALRLSLHQRYARENKKPSLDDTQRDSA